VTPGAVLDPARTYRLGEVAALLGKSARALQAQLRRAQTPDARVVAVTPWISAYRFCGGREWRFCSSTRSRLAPDAEATDEYSREDSYKKIPASIASHEAPRVIECALSREIGRPGVSMGEDLIREETRGNRRILVIDFLFTDITGAQRRYRRDASAQQDRSAATKEAHELHELAVTTGSPFGTTNSGMPTFGAFFEDSYRELYFPQLRPATQQRYDALMRQGLLGFFGRHPLDQIDFLLVRRYEAKVLARSVKTRGHVNLIRSVLRAAVELRILPKFPDVPTAKGPGKKLPRSPTREEVEQMVEQSRGWVRTAIVLAFYVGLRSGELRALQVRDIDFERNQIYVRRAFSENVLQDRPKDNDERIIPIAELALDQLQKAVQGLNPEDFLVTNRNGRTPTRQGVWLAFRAVQDKAGLDRRFGVHALRHGFCTELVRSNVGVETVRVLAGHEDLRTTQRYLHSERMDLVDAMETFSTASRRLAVTSR
jgi:integrase